MKNLIIDGEDCVSYLLNIRMFVRVYALGNMSSAARDQRVSPAVASGRISSLEKHLGVRLFNRTTRKLQPTEHGRLYYQCALKIIEAVEEGEAIVADSTRQPRGTIHVSAPLGVGKRFIAQAIPSFKEKYPKVDVRLRLTDRKVDMTKEGLDVSFVLGLLDNSSLRMRKIAECQRVLCASPNYIAYKGLPQTGYDLLEDDHHCLSLRFPGATEIGWTLMTEKGPEVFDVKGPFESDDGDVLTYWALDGRGIINKPLFEVAKELEDGLLVPVATETPPVSVYLAGLYPHKNLQDPKIRLFIDFMADICKKNISGKVTKGS